jgi:hypothetical protein
VKPFGMLRTSNSLPPLGSTCLAHTTRPTSSTQSSRAIIPPSPRLAGFRFALKELRCETWQDLAPPWRSIVSFLSAATSLRSCPKEGVPVNEIALFCIILLTPKEVGSGECHLYDGQRCCQPDEQVQQAGPALRDGASAGGGVGGRVCAALGGRTRGKLRY